MPLVQASVGRRVETLRSVLPALMPPNRVRENSTPRPRRTSLLVQPEAVGDCGGLAAAGDPELGEDP